MKVTQPAKVRASDARAVTQPLSALAELHFPLCSGQGRVGARWTPDWPPGGAGDGGFPLQARAPLL